MQNKNKDAESLLEIPLTLLTHLKEHMEPHNHPFHIIELMEFVLAYAQLHDLPEDIPDYFLELPSQPKPDSIKILMRSLKGMCVYFGHPSLTYEQINEYSFNRQLTVLATEGKDEEYLQTGQHRVRLDENLKLCIMPMSKLSKEGKSLAHNPHKINAMVFRENMLKGSPEQVYAMTSEYITQVSLRPELIPTSGNYERQGRSCWYHYSASVITPHKQTLSVGQGGQNSYQLHIVKASVSPNMMGLLTLDHSFSVEPLGSKPRQGYVGNMFRDVPDGLKETKCTDVLLFSNYGDNDWVIINRQYIYVYRIPPPQTNCVLNDQDNLSTTRNSCHNRLLILVQRIPAGCTGALMLTRPFIALMLQQQVLIIKLCLNDTSIPPCSTLQASTLPRNYYKITNKVFNDVRYKAMCFHEQCQYLFLSDFGAYLTRMKLNSAYGDAEEEGLIYHPDKAQQLSEYVKKAQVREGYIEEGKAEGTLTDVNKKSQDYLSLYAKQSKSPSTIVTHNHSRNIMSMLATSRHFSTLVTFQESSYEKPTKEEVYGEKCKEYGKEGRIKLWDIHHLNAYQCFIASVEISSLSLQSNGVFILTEQRGYMGYYPFNESALTSAEEKKHNQLKETSQASTEMNEELSLAHNVLYFHTLKSNYNKFSNSNEKETKLWQMRLSNTPQATLLKTVPCQVASIVVSRSIYVLESVSLGQSGCNLHIYNRQGLKEQLLSFSNSEDIDVLTGKNKNEMYDKEFKHLLAMEHRQFDVALWNNKTIKMIGQNRHESLTLVWHNPFNPHPHSHPHPHLDYTRLIHSLYTHQKHLIVHSVINNKPKSKPTPMKSKGGKGSKSGVSSSSNKEEEMKAYSLVVISLETDRILYCIGNASRESKIVGIFHSIVGVKEPHPIDPDRDTLSIYDLMLEPKLLFVVSFNRTWKGHTTAYHNTQEHSRNIIAQQVHTLLQSGNCTLEECVLEITDDNRLLLTLLFKTENTLSDPLAKRTMRTDINFVLYSRDISEQLIDREYKINKHHINKTLRKHAYQFQATRIQTERVLSHSLMSYEELINLSNYADISLPESYHSAKDISPSLQKAHNECNEAQNEDGIGIERIVMNKQPYMPSLMKQSSNPAASSLMFQGRILQYGNGIGTISIVNKQLRIIKLHTFSVQPSKKGVRVEVKRLTTMRVSQDIIPKGKLDKNQQITGEVEILTWNDEYKLPLDQLWERTYLQLRNYLLKQKERKVVSKGEEDKKKQKSSIKRNRAQESTPPRQIAVPSRRSFAVSPLRLNPPETPFVPNSQNLSKMFTKWSIAQGIQVAESLEKEQREKESHRFKRLIQRIGDRQSEKHTRMQTLIESTQQIKHISHRYHNQSSLENVDEVYETSILAKKASLKNYLLQNKLRQDRGREGEGKSTKIGPNPPSKTSVSNPERDIRITNQTSVVSASDLLESKHPSVNKMGVQLTTPQQKKRTKTSISAYPTGDSPNHAVSIAKELAQLRTIRCKTEQQHPLNTRELPGKNKLGIQDMKTVNLPPLSISTTLPDRISNLQPAVCQLQISSELLRRNVMPQIRKMQQMLRSKRNQKQSFIKLVAAQLYSDTRSDARSKRETRSELIAALHSFK